MKVIAPEYQNKITLSTLLLELQFSMELSQLETVLSCYQELFAFFLQYWFLLKNREIASQGGDFALKEDELTTPDPARDGANWLVYCAANPVGRWDPTGLTTLDDWEYQQRTKATAEARKKDEIIKNGVQALAATGQSQVSAKDIYYGGQKMTQALSVAVVGNTQYLDDKTRQSLQGKSAAEIEATLDQVTYVFGVSQADVDKTIDSLRAAGIDIDYPVDSKLADAFSIAGYVFVFEKESQWGTKGNDGKLNLYTSDDKYLLGHELIHQLQSHAWGGPSSFLAEYNRQYNESAKKYSGTEIYYNVSFEIDAYTFGPENYLATTRFSNNNYVRW